MCRRQSKRSPDAAGGLFHPRLAGHYGKYAEAHARLQQGLRRYKRSRLAVSPAVAPTAAAQIVDRLPGLRLIEIVFAEQDRAPGSAAEFH